MDDEKNEGGGVIVAIHKGGIEGGGKRMTHFIGGSRKYLSGVEKVRRTFPYH